VPIFPLIVVVWTSGAFYKKIITFPYSSVLFQSGHVLYFPCPCVHDLSACWCCGLVGLAAKYQHSQRKVPPTRTNYPYYLPVHTIPDTCISYLYGPPIPPPQPFGDIHWRIRPKTNWCSVAFIQAKVWRCHKRNDVNIGLRRRNEIACVVSSNV
jgi:hypothetical protein